MKVLITGGSGLIGTALTQFLLNKNVPVVHLTRYRNSKNDVKTYEWDWEKSYIDENCFNNVTHIVHLAGAGIADKAWTTKRKNTIVKSRVLTSRLILNAIKKNNIKIQTFISASGIGYYGAITNEKIYTELDKSNNDFISDCCIQWENSADHFNDICRVVKFRLGIVLNKNEGVLPKISRMIQKGTGSPLGNGIQYMPWIHLEDAIMLFWHALTDDKLKGTYNAVASEHVNNRHFTHKIATTLNKKIRLPNLPSFVLKFIYGELADILLNGVKVSNEKVIQTNFQFKFDKLEDALVEIYK